MVDKAMQYNLRPVTLANRICLEWGLNPKTRSTRTAVCRFAVHSPTLALPEIRRYSVSKVRAIESSIFKDSTDIGEHLIPNGQVGAAFSSEVHISGQNQHCFNYAHTIGIIGGISTRATAEFMRKIVEATPQSDGIPLLLCSDPLMRQILMPSSKSLRDSLLKSGVDKDNVPLQNLFKMRRFLEQSGARCIVMPCHVSHFWYDKLKSDCSVPFLSIADSVAEELKAANLQPLEAGSKPKIGILATEATLAAGFYQKELVRQGFEVVLPDEATKERIVLPGIEALQRHDLKGARNLLRIAIQMMLVNAVNMVVFACHDMISAFETNDPLLEKCIDPMNSLAKSTIGWIEANK